MELKSEIINWLQDRTDADIIGVLAIVGCTILFFAIVAYLEGYAIRGNEDLDEYHDNLRSYERRICDMTAAYEKRIDDLVVANEGYKAENEKLRKMVPGPAVLKADPEKAEAPKSNIFADAYHLSNVQQSIGIRCECGWHGGTGELVRTYGRTRCPYCGKEFKEVQ